MRGRIYIRERGRQVKRFLVGHGKLFRVALGGQALGRKLAGLAAVHVCDKLLYRPRYRDRQEDTQKAGKLGADATLAKPFSPAVLAATVEQLLAAVRPKAEELP